jgi:hypothetical protein
MKFRTSKDASEIGMKPRLRRQRLYSETGPKEREAFLPVFIVCSQDAARSRAA